MDLAGNEDSNMQLVTVPLTCADVGNDDGAGCSSSVAPYSDPPLTLLALVLLRRRRWRR